MKSFKCILLWCLALTATGAAADDYGQQAGAAADNPVVPATHTRQSYQVGLGPTQLLDTYLSQEKFRGTGLTFLTTTERYGSKGTAEANWRTNIQHQLSLSAADDRSGSREELQGDYSFFIGRMRHWQACTWNDGRNTINVEAGGLLNGNLGFIYNTSNSNNPAQARASVNIMPVVAADCHVNLFKRRLVTRYELNLPLVGVAFSPNYGQSYYEIFSLGNYDHNLVPTTFVSAPSVRQQLTVDYQLWRNASLRIGYLGDYQQLRVNQLKSHVVHHRVMVGYVHYFTHIKPLKSKQ